MIQKIIIYEAKDNSTIIMNQPVEIYIELILYNIILVLKILILTRHTHSKEG